MIASQDSILPALHTDGLRNSAPVSHAAGDLATLHISCLSCQNIASYSISIGGKIPRYSANIGPVFDVAYLQSGYIRIHLTARSVASRNDHFAVLLGDRASHSAIIGHGTHYVVAILIIEGFA